MAQELADFLIEVSNNPAQAEAFRVHPDRILDESRLDEEARNLIKSGDIQGIQEKIERSEGVHSATGRSAISIVLPKP